MKTIIPTNQFFQECLNYLGLLLREPKNRKMQEGNGVARAGRYEKNALYYVVHNMLLLLQKNTTHAHNAILQFILRLILVQIFTQTNCKVV